MPLINFTLQAGIVLKVLDVFKHFGFQSQVQLFEILFWDINIVEPPL